MSFKKLLLATAIAAVSTSSFAMQSMDDESLSSTTGQDGLTITVTNTDLAAFTAIIHDTDGFATGNTFDGGIKISGIDVGALNLTIDVDAGAPADTGTGATLQAKIYNTTDLVVNLGTLTVGNSNRDNAGTWGTTNDSGTIASLGSLTIGATNSAAPLLTIQMGNEPQGAWMKLKPIFTGGLSLTNFTLYDSAPTAATYGIKIGSLSIVDNGGANLTADISINATASGLALTTTQLGNATNGMDVRMAGVVLGTVASASSIGDVELVGLNLNNTTIAIIGH